MNCVLLPEDVNSWSDSSACRKSDIVAIFCCGLVLSDSTGVRPAELLEYQRPAASQTRIFSCLLCQ